MGLLFSSKEETGLCSQLLLPKGELLSGKALRVDSFSSTTWAPTVCGMVAKEGPRIDSQGLRVSRALGGHSWDPSGNGRLTPFLRQHIPGCLC